MGIGKPVSDVGINVCPLESTGRPGEVSLVHRCNLHVSEDWAPDAEMGVACVAWQRWRRRIEAPVDFLSRARKVGMFRGNYDCRFYIRDGMMIPLPEWPSLKLVTF